MFESATIRMTAWYLAIVMCISVGFSVALYRVATGELGRGLQKQALVFQQRTLPFGGPGGVGAITVSPVDQLSESAQRLRNTLILYNLLILLVAGWGSYLWARQTLAPIEAAHEAQTRFTADASHELRTPLAAMRAEIEVALREKKISSEEARALLESNLEEISKLESLANGLLRLARYQGGTAVPEWETVASDEIVAAAVRRVASLQNEKKITIDTQEVDHIQFDGDTVSLTELFAILLENAIKYSDSGKTIRVEAIGDKQSVKIAVADEGRGIKATDLPHIFQRFYRANASRFSEKVEGYGLGLSIASSIVDLHSGTITAKSSPGDGSTFIVTLPKQQKTV